MAPPAPSYRPAWWLPSAHLHTLWGRFFRRTRLPVRVERWPTGDDDEMEVHRLATPAIAGSPRLIVLHGLEGGPRSHYVGGLFQEAARRGWGADLLVFRSCGSELNRARRFYHSGETGDALLLIERIAAEHPASPLLLAGVSLGGNVLLKLLGERGDDLPPAVRAAAAVSVPFDLARGARFISRGFSKVYERHFLRSLRRKAMLKLERYPDLCSRDALLGARTLFDFDDVVTAPIHGFASADDYYTRSSSLRFLHGIRRPTLLLSAADDPFLPRDVLDLVRTQARHNPDIEIEFVERGGHVGFVSGSVPWRPLYWAEHRVTAFLAQHAGREAGADVHERGNDRRAAGVTEGRPPAPAARLVSRGSTHRPPRRP